MTDHCAEIESFAQSDVSFSFVGRATPKGDEATCICLLDSFALVGSRSGTIYSLNLDSGSRVEFSKSAQHSSSVLSICSTKHGVLSMDQDSNLILWSKQGACTASTTGHWLKNAFCWSTEGEIRGPCSILWSCWRVWSKNCVVFRLTFAVCQRTGDQLRVGSCKWQFCMEFRSRRTCSRS